MARYQLRTSLSPEFCRSRLDMKRRTWRHPFAGRRSRPVKGRVSVKGFSIEKNAFWGNPFAPRAKGIWMSAPQGTIIAVTVGMPLSVASSWF